MDNSVLVPRKQPLQIQNVFRQFLPDTLAPFLTPLDIAVLLRSSSRVFWNVAETNVYSRRRMVLALDRIDYMKDCLHSRCEQSNSRCSCNNILCTRMASDVCECCNATVCGSDRHLCETCGNTFCLKCSSDGCAGCEGFTQRCDTCSRRIGDGCGCGFDPDPSACGDCNGSCEDCTLSCGTDECFERMCESCRGYSGKCCGCGTGFRPTRILKRKRVEEKENALSQKE